MAIMQIKNGLPVRLVLLFSKFCVVHSVVDHHPLMKWVCLQTD